MRRLSSQLTLTTRHTSHNSPSQPKMDNIINSILNFNVWSIGKFFVLVGLGVYVIFTFVVVRQVAIMTQVVTGLMTWFLRIVSWVFFLFAIFVFIFILLLL